MAQVKSSKKAEKKDGTFAVTVDVVLFTFQRDQLQVLLIKRRNPPFQGMWAFPGGFVEPDEDLDAAAGRELHEETGLRDLHLIQLRTFGKPGRDPRMRIISVVYLALTHFARMAPQAGDDAAEAKWHPLAGLPPMAFDHAEILDHAQHYLRTHAYDSIVFQLLPSEFTLGELQAVCESISNEKLDKRNFRRKILQSNTLRATGNMQLGEGRPARLYSYRGR
jgi:8-oxo-dGTP diphosphatase